MMSQYLFNIDKIIILVVSLVYNSLQHNHIPLFLSFEQPPKNCQKQNNTENYPKKTITK